MMNLVIPSMGPGALLSTGLMRCPPRRAAYVADLVHCLRRAACVAPDAPDALSPMCWARCPWHTRRGL